jgi:uncharacterized repeat protein (TIGR03803 family)
MSVVKLLTTITLVISAGLPPLASQARTLTTLYSFGGGTDGFFPEASLVYQGGVLYGTTALGGGGVLGGGIVFAVNASTGAETVLHRFTGAPDGDDPEAGLLYQDGALYGTTAAGGASNFGTVFKIDPATGAETVLHSFTGGADGDDPQAGLIDYRDALYGTTALGGAAGLGTVFRIDLGTGAETVLYSFAGGTDGAYPVAGLLSINSDLYGTTGRGGAALGFGTVFKISAVTRAETVLYRFNGGTDGAYPRAGLIHEGDPVHDGGTLYGTTMESGPGVDRALGTVFALKVATGALTVLHSFQAIDWMDGANPYAGLLRQGNNLYGTTSGGGGPGVGTVFYVKSATGAERVLIKFAFNEANGAAPMAGLIAAGNILYGTTRQGGAAGNGTVFEITP